MRALAMPDAECPRCNARQPPPESVLATCARCGLVFTPHELPQRPRPAPSNEPLPQLPGVHVRIIGDRFEIRWGLDRVIPILPAFLLGIVWMGITIAPARWSVYVVTGVPSAVVAYVLVNSMISDHVLAISPAAIAYRVAPLPRLFGRARAVDRAMLAGVQMIRTPNLRAGHHYRFVARTEAGDIVLFRAEPLVATSIGALLTRLVPFSRLD